MKIVIEIPEEVVDKHDFSGFFGCMSPALTITLLNGTILARGHGRLIDADELLSDLNQLCYDESSLADNPYIENPHIDSIVDVVENARTIIPADEEEG